MCTWHTSLPHTHATVKPAWQGDGQKGQLKCNLHTAALRLLQACIVLAETRHTWPHARRPPKTFRYMTSFAPPYSSVCYCIQYISHKQQLKPGKVCLVHSLRQYSPSQQGRCDHRIRRQSVTCPQSGSRGMAFFFFTHPETPSHRRVPATFRVGLFPQLNLSGNIPIETPRVCFCGDSISSQE